MAYRIVTGLVHYCLISKTIVNFYRVDKKNHRGVKLQHQQRNQPRKFHTWVLPRTEGVSSVVFVLSPMPVREYTYKWLKTLPVKRLILGPDAPLDE